MTVTQEQAAQGCRVTAGYVDGQRLEITVSAGTKDGSVLRCRGMGQPGSNGGRNGDLLVTVRVQEPPEPDGLYDAPKDPPVKGGDLRATVYITPDQAARGCQLRVTLSGGGTRQVTIPGGCTDGKRLRYTGMGQPGSNGGKSGDLLVTVRVQEPEPAPQPAQSLEKITTCVNLKPGEAAQGCTKSISFKHKGKKVSMTLSIPAGVVYGEKLHYPRVRADDGILYDVTAVVEVSKSDFLATGLFGALGFISIVTAVFVIWSSFMVGIGVLVEAAVWFAIGWVIQKITESHNKKKYGPKTPEEKRRCETPREMPPLR